MMNDTGHAEPRVRVTWSKASSHPLLCSTLVGPQGILGAGEAQPVLPQGHCLNVGQRWSIGKLGYLGHSSQHQPAKSRKIQPGFTATSSRTRDRDGKEGWTSWCLWVSESTQLEVRNREEFLPSTSNSITAPNSTPIPTPWLPLVRCDTESELPPAPW